MTSALELQPAASTLVTAPPMEGFLFTADTNLLNQLPESVNPIPHRALINGLGSTALLGVRTTGVYRADQTARQHRLYGISIDGYQHAVEITDPADSEPQYAIMSLPGYTEHIECGIRQSFHTGLAEKFPAGRIISVATDGIGPHAGEIDWHHSAGHDIVSMAEHRIQLAQLLAARLPLYVQATSMGSVISHRMHQQLLADPALRTAVDPRGQFLISPALVDPTKVVRDMGLRFPPGLVWDLTKEMLLKSSPFEALGVLNKARSHGLNAGEAAALGVQLWDLLHGTPEADIANVVSEIPTTVVAGSKDCLAQWPMWRRLATAYPGQLELHSIRGRGHILAVKPGRTCDKLSRTAQARLISTLPLLQAS